MREIKRKRLSQTEEEEWVGVTKNITKRNLKKNCKCFNKKIFEESCISNENREKRCRILKTLTKKMRATTLQPLPKD